MENQNTQPSHRQSLYYSLIVTRITLKGVKQKHGMDTTVYGHQVDRTPGLSHDLM